MNALKQGQLWNLFSASIFLSVGRRELRRGGELVALEPQVCDLLNYLIENRDRVVSKDGVLRGCLERPDRLGVRRSLPTSTPCGRQLETVVQRRG